MRRIIGAAFLSLDGVMQAPGGPTEDWTGGFVHGGWMAPVADEAVGEVIGRVFDRDYDLLLGRRTYDIFAAYWPYMTGEEAAMGQAFTRATKYVLTRGQDPLPWENSERLSGVDALAAVKAGDGPDLIIQGSSTIYPALLEAGLIDRLTTMTFPLILGGGKRLFGDGTPARTLKMVDHLVSSTGVVIATYEPAGAVETGSFQPEGYEPSAREVARQERMKTEG